MYECMRQLLMQLVYRLLYLSFNENLLLFNILGSSKGRENVRGVTWSLSVTDFPFESLTQFTPTVSCLD